MKRQAHKKASIQVKLNEYIEGVGIKDDIVTVRPGLMRNILYPSGKASYVQKYTGPRNRELENEKKHVIDNDSSTDIQKEQRQEAVSKLVNELNKVKVLEFQRAVVPNSNHIFGSVSSDDLVEKLKEDYGINIEKSAIEFKSEGGRIKTLGDHTINVQIADVPTLIQINVKST
ncbi:hypothetical protein BJ944DRAFT_271646 [Cunninghamella echinulata]|nr:hypothetical protein BJ944DRAFT_271646 [Cunninghamella echinulata]